MKYFALIFLGLSIGLFGVVVLPTNTVAQQLAVDCNTETNADGTFKNPCDFNDVVGLVNNIIDFFVFKMMLPIAAIMFAYIGYTFITNPNNPAKRTEAKTMFRKLFIGFLVALAAWLIVNTILDLLGVDESFRTTA